MTSSSKQPISLEYDPDIKVYLDRYRIKIETTNYNIRQFTELIGQPLKIKIEFDEYGEDYMVVSGVLQQLRWGLVGEIILNSR